MPIKLSRSLFLSLVGVFFVLDRILKWLVQVKTIKTTLAPRLLDFEFYPNYKGPFSLPIPLWAIIAISSLLIIIFLILIFLPPLSSQVLQGKIWEGEARWGRFKFPLSLIIAGALSNLFDRVVYGYTIDTFQFLNFSFFNLADGLIFGGVILLVYKIFKKNCQHLYKVLRKE